MDESWHVAFVALASTFITSDAQVLGGSLCEVCMLHQIGC